MKLEFKVEKFDEPDLEQFEKDLCDALVERVKMRTPVRSGNLQNSVTGEVQTEEIIIGSDVDYAPHVEYGTINMSGRAMFRTALEELETLATQLNIKNKS